MITKDNWHQSFVVNWGIKEIRAALQNVTMDTWWNRAFEDFFKDKNLPVLAIKEHQTWTRIIVTPDTLTIWKWF